MANGSRVNGNFKLIIYVLLGAVAIGSTMYAIGADSTDQVEQNTEDIRCLERDSVAIQKDIEHIKQSQEDTQEDVKEILRILRETD